MRCLGKTWFWPSFEAKLNMSNFWGEKTHVVSCRFVFPRKCETFFGEDCVKTLERHHLMQKNLGAVSKG